MTSFLDYGLIALIACVAAMTAGGVVKGITGIGLPLVALPVMASFIPIPKAMALLLLSSFATSVWQSFHGGLFLVSVKRLWPLLVGIAIGVAASVRLLALLNLHALYLILGLIVVTFASLLHRRLVFTVSPAGERWAAPVTGVISGLVGGVSMLFGTIYAMYLSGLKLGKDAFVASVSLLNIWATIVLAVALAGNRLFSGTDMLGSVAAVAPAAFGVFLGQNLRRHINEEAFRKVLAFLLLAIGFNLIRKGLS